ncbi:MAG: type I restriction enzyme HsdR N-terminal domain-containing protein [Bacteroidetes bacterium]|nr:type I restriction enzyme HsdR N-terminal domain-containing protein [Bacteroidota bacterium]MBL6962347.1 type I restriction enzyme HsdR N-terminal domain-containing protein [Bacteroidota bacterium]
MLELSLPKYDYLVQKKEGKLFIFDSFRKKYILLTPEEWVRQHFVNYLITVKNTPVKLISLEKGLKYNRLLKRTDIVVYDDYGRALLLVECKASTVKLNEQVVFQLAIYNAELKAPFMGITNGLQHFYWKYTDGENNSLLTELPDYNEMIGLSDQ